MDQTKKAELTALLKELVNAKPCCKELKDIATKTLNSFDEKNIEALKMELKEDVTPIEDFIKFAESDMGKQIFGESRDAVLQDAKNKQKAGEKICTCDACQIGAKILNILK